MIHLKRVYEAIEAADAPCFLVDRLWPRGIKKESLRKAAWLKEVAPSAELRKWFMHDPKKWPEFRRRYFAELEKNPQAWKPIADAARKGDVILLFSSREVKLNNAVALKEFIEAKLGAKKKSRWLKSRGE